MGMELPQALMAGFLCVLILIELARFMDIDYSFTKAGIRILLFVILVMLLLWGGYFNA